MTNSEKAAGDAAKRGEKDKETDKRKRSRVKQLLGDIKKQVEFWFGDVNLHKDRFLRQLIDRSDSGYVDISVLTSFGRMKKLTADAKLIARALKNSSVVEVNLEGTKVRRQRPLGEPPENVDSRTVYVELLPKDVTHSWIERVFAKCGTVVYVSIPRYRSTGDSKGFAFVEFEEEEHAQKAVEMLNNPPEDAPRKPGIFPKTLNRKPIPFAADNPPSREEEKKKRKKKKKSTTTKEGAASQAPGDKAQGLAVAEAEPAEEKRKHAEPAGTQRNPTKAEKKRRRSQTAEGADGGVPAKIRKTSGSESEEKEKGAKICSPTKSEAAGNAEKGKENEDDSTIKAKRKRKKKHKEKLKIGEEVIPLRVLSKKEWLQLKDEYLILQKCSMASLKKCIGELGHTEGSGDAPGGNVEMKSNEEKEANQGPQFVNGVIMKITGSKPLPARKVIKAALSRVSPVAYVDILEGDVEGHIRFHSPQDAKAAGAARDELQREHGWKLEILTGDHEQRYWQKILVDRQVKLNRPREKKRGTEKLIAKAEKLIMARAKEANKHIHFDED
ncbi:la-related protein 7 [Kryptolebias marmoratus]|uniref:La-related protein 7 n=1 Tax=Kryptolebias marmoratus TaxID=37003 RepID=A0A3Q2ZU09_KRYMA|nr:la-related protein 7 [Kryptolebias marmoratus]